MRRGLFLINGALCIMFCAAADHNQLIQEKGQAIWQDLKVGKVAPNPAPPVLTQEGRKYAAKVMGSYAEEANTFKALESALIHGELDQKRWVNTVDQWVHDFEDALHSRKLPSLRKPAISDLISTTKKVLHAINEIDGTGQNSTSGLDVRQSVGILLSDLIESLRVEVSPFAPEQKSSAAKANMDNLRQRQLEMVTIIRGLLERIPAASSLLDDAVVEIVGRNEKERGKKYFMKHYAPNTMDGPSKKNIKHINGLYKGQQEKSLDNREKRYLALMNTLLNSLKQSAQNVPGQYHTGIAPDLSHPAVPSMGSPKVAKPSVSVLQTESALIASEMSTTNISNATALATPSATIATALELSGLTNSTSNASLPAQIDGPWITTVHPMITVTEPVTTTIHFTVTETEPLTTTFHPTVMANAPVPSITIKTPSANATVHSTLMANAPVLSITIKTPYANATVHPTVLANAPVPSITTKTPSTNATATLTMKHLRTRELNQQREEEEDDRHKKELAIGLGIGLPIFAAGAGWAAYKAWKTIDYTRRISSMNEAGRALDWAAESLKYDLTYENAELAKTAKAIAQKAAQNAADKLAIEKAEEYGRRAKELQSKASKTAMEEAQKLGQLKDLSRMGGELHTIQEESPSAGTGPLEYTIDEGLSFAEEVAGQIAQLAMNEAARDLATAGQLTESAVASLGKATPNLFSWLLSQTAHLGGAAFGVVKDAVAASHVRKTPSTDGWSDAGTGSASSRQLFENTDLLFGPAFRVLQGMSEAERLEAYKKDVKKWKKEQDKLDPSKSENSPEKNDASMKETAKTATMKSQQAPQKTKASIKETATMKSQQAPQKTKASIKETATTKGQDAPQKTDASMKETATTKGQDTPQKTDASIKETATTKGQDAPQKTDASMKETATTKGQDAPQKTDASMKETATTKGQDAPQKTDASMKETATTKGQDAPQQNDASMKETATTKGQDAPQQNDASMKETATTKGQDAPQQSDASMKETATTRLQDASAPNSALPTETGPKATTKGQDAPQQNDASMKETATTKGQDAPQKNDASMKETATTRLQDASAPTNSALPTETGPKATTKGQNAPQQNDASMKETATTKGQDAQKNDASMKETATTRLQDASAPTNSALPAETGPKAPGQGDSISTGSDITRIPEAARPQDASAPTNSALPTETGPKAPGQGDSISTGSDVTRILETARPQDASAPTNSALPTETGPKAPGQGDSISTGSDVTRILESAPATETGPKAPGQGDSISTGSDVTRILESAPATETGPKAPGQGDSISTGSDVTRLLESGTAIPTQSLQTVELLNAIVDNLHVRDRNTCLIKYDKLG
ncbi:gb [Venturia nashicola]|uniref:Gb n=1 Tax=Venturia nashicola TaxID=86259 RepID=A0A4Z1NZ92_9PEZI|nr:gb [Venturia nashicola]